MTTYIGKLLTFMLRTSLLDWKSYDFYYSVMDKSMTTKVAAAATVAEYRRRQLQPKDPQFLYSSQTVQCATWQTTMRMMRSRDMVHGIIYPEETGLESG